MRRSKLKMPDVDRVYPLYMPLSIRNWNFKLQPDHTCTHTSSFFLPYLFFSFFLFDFVHSILETGRFFAMILDYFWSHPFTTTYSFQYEILTHSKAGIFDHTPLVTHALASKLQGKPRIGHQVVRFLSRIIDRGAQSGSNNQVAKASRDHDRFHRLLSASH